MNNFEGVDSGKYVYRSDKTPRLYHTITPDPRFRHLGDLINIAQRYSNADLIVGTGVCPCCGNDIWGDASICVRTDAIAPQTDVAGTSHASVVRPSSCETPPLRWPAPYRKAIHPP
jgi:hypothetical protein